MSLALIDRTEVCEMTLSVRAEKALRIMRGEDPPPDGLRGFRDGEWVRLAQVPTVGRKTLNELLTAGVIEARGNPGYRLPSYLYFDQFRLRNAAPPDLGDLWIE